MMLLLQHRCVSCEVVCVAAAAAPTATATAVLSRRTLSNRLVLLLLPPLLVLMLMLVLVLVLVLVLLNVARMSVFYRLILDTAAAVTDCRCHETCLSSSIPVVSALTPHIFRCVTAVRR